MDSLNRRSGRFELHSDQRAAAAQVLLSGNRLDAIVGPAGTGKTTTLGAVKDAWEAEFGAGSVVGLAPAAASAEVLGRQLAMATENVAKWLHESVGQGASHRAERFFATERRLGSVGADVRRTTRLVQEAARLAAEQDRWQFRPNQLVVVDEASMVSTLQLSALVHQAEDAGAKILLVGDPAQLDAVDAGGVLGWLDRLGKATRLTTIWRFEHEWERGASLKLRSGDYSALADYDQHARLRHGSYLDMVDQAYSAWQSDIQSGKSSILIAADNDTVSMLNERAQADLVVQGAVDAEQTVLLSDGLQAGLGDTIIARRNDRSITDSNGDFIRNGTLLDVGCIRRRDGSLVAVRRDTGATITLPGAYVEASLELGYATTAHRSQGITVDTGHTVVTQGGLTRELLYVSMTRGRSSNSAYVSEIDPVDHAALDPSLQPSWREILGEVLAAEGAERTAHEVREAELTRADSLERLSAEYDYLAQIAAAEDLARVLRLHAVGSVTALEQSPSWGAAVAAWRRSSVVARPTAERLVLEAAKTSTPATDIVAVLQSRLRHTIDRMPAGLPNPITEPLHTNRSDLTKMIREVRERMQRRMTTVATSALIQDDEWKQNLLNSLEPDTGPVEANRVISSVAVFRDRWGIGDSPLPLGPIPSEYEWEQKAQRLDLEAEIHRSTLHSPIEAPQEWATNPTRHLDAVAPAGWQL